MTTLSIRFDIDTLACIEQGVPALLRLAQELGVRFSFYINMGYSFNLRNALSRFRKGAESNNIVKLTPIEKLGLRKFLKTIILNPPVGASNISMLERIVEEGHELGLHGGFDHTQWQHFLPEQRNGGFTEMFDQAYVLYKKYFGAPAGFCSPGFKHNAMVYGLLQEYNFSYVSDLCGDHPIAKAEFGGKQFSMNQIPVNLVAPYSVPILEYYYALEMPTPQIITEVSHKIENRDFAVFYGHPCFEGKKGLAIMRQFLVSLVKTREIIPMSQLNERFFKEL